MALLYCSDIFCVNQNIAFNEQPMLAKQQSVLAHIDEGDEDAEG